MLDEVDGLVDRPKLRAEMDAALENVGGTARPLTPEEWSRSPEAQAAQAQAMAQMRSRR